MMGCRASRRHASKGQQLGLGRSVYEHPRQSKKLLPISGRVRDESARDSDGTQYTVFTSDDQPRSGLVLAKRSEIEPNWLPFGLVGDFDAKLERAVKLGGRVLAREGGSAIVIDPTGAATGVIGRKGETE